MKSTRIFSLLVLALLVVSSMQLGTLYINRIIGNLDLETGAQRVRIEEVIFDDNTIQVDRIGELETTGTGGGEGTAVEGVLFKDGSKFVPENLDVGAVATVSGRLIFNGGLVSDSIFPDFPSFSVDDDTGITTILGILFQNDNINADDGRFFVEGITGETTIKGLTRPDGGINVLTDVFEVVADTGDYFVSRDIYVGKDIVLGTNEPTDNAIRRVASFLDGGDTYISGQNAPAGGNLVLTPGFGSGSEPTVFNGDILFGRDQPDDLYLTRIDTPSGNGGRTIFTGQDAGGRGGPLYLEAGRGDNASGGGSIFLIPGGSPAINGKIILGATETAVSTSALRIGRPALFSGSNGGLTSIIGQDTTGGTTAAGDLTIRAGAGTSAGHIFLLPGESDKNGDSGDILIGGTIGTELFVSRDGPVAVGDGGATRYQGQSSFNFEGGDVYIAAGFGGNDGVTDYPGGQIFIDPGNNGAGGAYGDIIWGGVSNDLIIGRQTTENTAGFDLLIAGQDTTSNGQNGGNLVFAAGDFIDPAPAGPLNFHGGVLNLESGAGEFEGGLIEIRGGVSTDAGTGGNVDIRSGNHAAGSFGDIYISAGAGFTPGDLFFESGESLNLGTVTFNNLDEFVLEDSDFFYIQSASRANNLQITGNNGITITFSVDPTQYITFNDGAGDVFFIRNRYDATSISYPVTNPTDDTVPFLQQIAQILGVVIDGLSNHHTIIRTA